MIKRIDIEMFIVLINDRLMILTHLIIFHFGQICQPPDG